jgi:hypothetical protein
MPCCRRPPAYTPTAQPLDIIRVEIMRGAYCPPAIEATWSPTAGAFVVREAGPAPPLVQFFDAFMTGAVLTLALWAGLRISGVL